MVNVYVRGHKHSCDVLLPQYCALGGKGQTATRGPTNGLRLKSHGLLNQLGAAAHPVQLPGIVGRGTSRANYNNSKS